MAKAAKHVVTERKKSTARVVRVARRFAASTARELRKLLAPELAKGEEMPDLVFLQELMAEALQRCLRRLMRADVALADLEREDAKLRRQRDASLRVLHRQLGDLRTLVTGRLGREPSRTFLGLKGESSRDPIVLLRQADRAVERLRDFEKKPRGAGFSDAERERRAAPLAEQADVLRQVDRQVGCAAKDLDAARLDRRRALADFNQVFIRIAFWFEQTYRAIGRDDLADKVRPSKQYPGRTAAEMKERSRPAAAEPEPAARLLSFDPLRHVARALGFRNVAASDRR